MTETYVAAKLFVDNWRWADTPFYVRTGKRLARRETTDRDSVPAGSAPAVRGRGDRGAAPEPPPRARPAGRGRLPRDRREGAGAGDAHPDRAHGLHVRRDLPHRPARGLRAADPRRHARRPDALHALGRGRGAMGARGCDRRRLVSRPSCLPQLSGGHVGPCDRGRAHAAATAGSGCGIERDRRPGRGRGARRTSRIGDVVSALHRLRSESAGRDGRARTCGRAS